MPAFGTFQHAYKLMYGVKAFMPPQGLLLIAAYMPEELAGPLRRREHRARRRDADFAWADIVLVTGMHIQVEQIRDIQRRAQAAGKVTVLGGPSVSASPEMYPDYDYLHVGEMGDATDAIVASLDESVAPAARADACSRPRSACRSPISRSRPTTASRSAAICSARCSSPPAVPICASSATSPASTAASRGMKTPQQIVAELDFMFSQPNPPATIYFVDDNFIGNRKAAKEMLPHLVEWQKRRGYPVMFACEATLNIAKQTEILELMKEASFIGMFVGIETPEADALDAMRKGHNNAVPMLESIKTLNNYGIEITSGIILGLDTDTPDTEAAAEGLHRAVEHPDADHQPAAGAAQDAAVGPAQARGSPLEDDGAREQCRVPAPLRRGGGDVAAQHRLRQRSGKPVRALPPSGRGDLPEPQGDAREGQAHLGEPAPRRGAGVARRCSTSACCRTSAGRSGGRRSTRCATARSTACSARLSWATT